MQLNKRVAGLALAAMFFVSSVPVLADEVDDKQAELNTVQQQMQYQQQRVQKAQQQVESVSEQLRKIQSELDAAQKDYKDIQNKLAATEKQIEKNEAILAQVEQELGKRTKVFNTRIRDIYMHGQLNYLDVLFGAKDFNDFTTRMELLKRIILHDVELMKKIQAERELVLTKKAELDRDRAAILELKKQAEVKRQLVNARKQEREKVLQSAVSERDSAERAYQELLETSRQIEAMIRRIQSGGKPSISSGAMMWPISGPITSEYGWRTHPIFGTARYHSGLDIGADYGEHVAAADNGVVIYADWMGGYGKAVIIDHGGGISTLYGHNSELLVREGQTVVKGQTIAYAGSTGYSTGPHVHFEVRKNGEPVNPMEYLP